MELLCPTYSTVTRIVNKNHQTVYCITEKDKFSNQGRMIWRPLLFLGFFFVVRPAHSIFCQRKFNISKYHKIMFFFWNNNFLNQIEIDDDVKTELSHKLLRFTHDVYHCWKNGINIYRRKSARRLSCATEGATCLCKMKLNFAVHDKANCKMN